MTTAEMLIHRLQLSRFFAVLCSVSATVLFDIEGEVLLASTGSDRLRIRSAVEADEYEADLVVKVGRRGVESGNLSGSVSVRTSGSGQRIHPTYERVLLRCLSDLRVVDSVEISELFYSPIFGFSDPRVVWTSPEPGVTVQRFSWLSRGCDAVVTNGLHAVFPSQPFELVLLVAPQNDESLQKELVGWARYAIERKAVLRSGEWLEYEQGSIPGTRFSAFLILPPILLPRKLPAGDGTADLLLLLPVTGAELARAKATTSTEVAQSLFESGVTDIRQ